MLTVDGRAHRARAEGADGPQLVWDEQPELPLGAVYLGEADGVPYAAVRGERSLTVNGRPVDTWAGLREVGADLGDLDAGLLVAGHRHPRVARAATGSARCPGPRRRSSAPAGCSATR